MTLFFLCLIFFDFLVHTIISAISTANGIPTAEIARLKHSAEYQTSSECTLLTWVEKSETLNQILHATDLNHQLFVHVNFESLNMTVFEISPLKFTMACNFVVYSHTDVLSSKLTSKFPPVGYIYGIQGNLYSYHVILSTADAKDALMKKPKSPSLLPLHIRRCANFVLIITGATYYEYYDADVTGKLRRYSSPAFFRDRSNFQGLDMIWALLYVHTNALTKEKISAYMAHEPRGYVDFMIETVSSVSTYFNATPRFVANLYEDGVRNPNNGKWTGVVGSIVHGRAHVTAYTTLSISYAEAMIPTVAIGEHGIAFFTGLPKIAAQYNPLAFILSALDPVVVFIELLTVISIAVVIMGSVMRAMKQANCKKERLGFNQLTSLILNLLSQIVDQNYTSRLMKLTKSYILKLFVIGPWLLAINVLGSVLKTNLITNLTSPIMTNPPKTWEELASSDCSINMFGLSDSGVTGMFLTLLKANNSIARRINNKVVRHYELHGSFDCLRSTQLGNNVCIGSANVGSLVATMFLLRKNGEYLARISTETLGGNSAMYYSKNMPHLQGRFNRLISVNVQSGLYIRLAKPGGHIKSGKENALKRHKLNKLFPSEEETATGNESYFVFAVLMGNVFAVIVVMMEILKLKVLKFKNNKISSKIVLVKI